MNQMTGHTSSRIARQADIAFTGENVCKSKSDVRQFMSPFRHTRSMASATEAVDGSLDNIDTVALRDFTIWSLP